MTLCFPSVKLLEQNSPNEPVGQYLNGTSRISMDVRLVVSILQDTGEAFSPMTFLTVVSTILDRSSFLRSWKQLLTSTDFSRSLGSR